MHIPANLHCRSTFVQHVKREKADIRAAWNEWELQLLATVLAATKQALHIASNIEAALAVH